MRLRILILNNILLWQLVLAQSTITPAEVASLINSNEVYTFNQMLANDFGGRLTGDSGYTKSAEWAASLFQSWKIKPYDQKLGYLQHFSAPYTIVKNAEMMITLPALTDTSKEQELQLKPGEDFIPLLYSDGGEKDGNLVFAGWGISAPELGYDDYNGIDVKGKFALCFRGTPKQDSAFTHYDEHRIRMQTAKKKGALGIFYIYNEPIANPNGELLPDFLPAIISYGMSDRILAEKGWKTAVLRDSLTRQKNPISFPLQAKVRLKVKSEHHAGGIGYNVIGYIEGSDPKLQNECIVIGAHLDHCGTHMGLKFPGANDNASGSAVVLEIAKAFSKIKKNPERSIAFVLFGGEEMGLLGSKFFVDHIPKQFNTIKAMINFDMVGEGDGAWCGYSATPEWVKNILDSANIRTNTVKGSRPIREIGVSTSDFASFFKKGISCFSFVSNGPHLHYHQAGDTIFRINPDILAEISRIGFLCAYYTANL
jgi:hypothetical protein